MNIHLEKEDKKILIKPKIQLYLISYFLIGYNSVFSFSLLLMYIPYKNIVNEFRVVLTLTILELMILIFVFIKAKINKQVKGIFFNLNIYFLVLAQSMFCLFLVPVWALLVYIIVYPLLKIYIILDLVINANKYELKQRLDEGYEIINFNELNEKEKIFINKSKNKKKSSYLVFKF